MILSIYVHDEHLTSNRLPILCQFILMIAVLPPIPSKPPTPSMDYFQTDTKITINIYTKRYIFV